MLRLCLLPLWGAAFLLPLVMNIQSCSASLAEANAASLAFRAGILFSKSASQNQRQQKVDNQLATAGEIEPQPVAGAGSADSASADSSAVGCQKLLLTHPIKLGIVEVHRAGLKQLLAGRKQLCSSFGADANACLNSQQFLKEVGELASPPSSLLIARAICHQFAEPLATNEQCIGELALDRLERQCADACHRRAHPSEQPLSSRQVDPEVGWAPHLAQSSLHLGGTDGLCQLSLCASNCLGTQLAECATENQQQQQNGQQQAEQLKQLVSRLAGLQMLAGIQQQQNGGGGAAQAAPAECARIIEEAVASSSRHADASVNLSMPN